MARSPITQLIELFHGLTPDQQALFLDQVDPQPDEEEKPAKKARKKSAGKSKRASGIAETLGSNLAQRRRSTADDATGESQSSSPLCTACGHEQGYQDHFQPSPHYHAFAAPKTAQSAAGD
jgi:hypothetical protein